MHTVVDGGVVHFINFHCEQVDVSVLDASCGRGDSAAPPPPSVANGFVSKYGRCVPENWKKILLNHSVTHPIFFKILFSVDLFPFYFFWKNMWWHCDVTEVEIRVTSWMRVDRTACSAPISNGSAHTLVAFKSMSQVSQVKSFQRLLTPFPIIFGIFPGKWCVRLSIFVHFRITDVWMGENAMHRQSGSFACFVSDEEAIQWKCWPPSVTTFGRTEFLSAWITPAVLSGFEWNTNRSIALETFCISTFESETIRRSAELEISKM